MASFETAARADSAGILLPLILLMVVFGCGKKLETQEPNRAWQVFSDAR
jgi:hypothetical protein